METPNECVKRKMREKSEERMFMMVDPLPDDSLPSHKVLIIGLVGGIGAGKSTVASIMAEDPRIAVIDSDKITRDELNDSVVVEQLVKKFGDVVKSPDGTTDRKALAAIVFNDPEQLKRLEDYLHPLIKAQQSLQLVRLASGLWDATGADWGKKPKIEAIVLDAPLLFEVGMDKRCDTIICVCTSKKTMLERTESRGWTPQQYEKREKSQIPISEKISRSNHIIPNERGIEELRTMTTELIQALLPNPDIQATIDQAEKMAGPLFSGGPRDPARIPKVLERIKEIWESNPDLRLCQLIGNCWSAGNHYNKEEDELMERLDIIYGKIDSSESVQE